MECNSCKSTRLNLKEPSCEVCGRSVHKDYGLGIKTKPMYVDVDGHKLRVCWRCWFQFKDAIDPTIVNTLFNKDKKRHLALVRSLPS